MYHDFNFASVLSASARAAWQIEDILPEGAALDFSRPFMPENLARTDVPEELSEAERRVLNQIRGHEYLVIFGLVEEFILPFVLDHARPQLNGDDARVRALLNFAGEEAKHIDLFKRFHACFVRDFGSACAVIGPPEAIGAEVLRHDPLAVALVILQIEWMTQRHYVDSVRDDSGLDPLFKSLLKHHWMEEAHHAKLDTLMVEALAENRDEASIQSALDEYLEIGMFLDGGLKTQAGLNLDAFEKAVGRTLGADERAALLAQQHQALRWTYLGSGMTHPKFVATLAAMSPAARDRIAEVAPAFC
ncbi:diiron oxygenase [Croceibacterium sp. LX-88]|uniref:Diiron oxygenase n=1 Tax=Croceibacterium selenioxidans TaxID=2838833 RepID=A0ABS5W4Z5_9SPHN|nr:diiron oxygenase [Croceibacterium selenioxidans]MBT2133464.1 diiron oxygenase [Croceibacterium selenioxidans]